MIYFERNFNKNDKRLDELIAQDLLDT